MSPPPTSVTFLTPAGQQQVADLVGGHVPPLFDFLPVVEPHVKAGKARALAVTDERGLSNMPDVPTFDGQGPACASVLGRASSRWRAHPRPS
jgi:tripartite-type tricarboxylate transporter receptor subunit TctC